VTDVPLPERKAETDHPTAIVRRRTGWLAARPRSVSYWWWITALCAITVIVLLYYYNRTTGPRIWVHFQEGYGIQPGDRLRYRGIEVGEVVGVEMDEGLNGVNIAVRLDDAASGLAREGSRFWIERPRIGFSGVGGLETLIGGRYLAVLPGPEQSRPRRVFTGLENAPVAIDRVAGGMEIILDSPHRYGVNAGAPVTHRGVPIGTVLAVGLAGDAASVELRAYINPEYKSLIRENTRFWSISGFDMDIRLTGAHFSADSLATIAAGGIALATPESAGRIVSTGHRFQLERRPEDESKWNTWRPRLAVGAAQLPEGSALPRPLRGLFKWDKRTLGIRREQRQEGWVLAIDDGRLIAPANLLAPPADSKQETGALELGGQEFQIAADTVKHAGDIAFAQVELPASVKQNLWPARSLRAPKELEDAILAWGARDPSTPLPAARMTATEAAWQIDSSIPLDPDAHGAPVVATRDGAVIGILVVKEDSRYVVPLKGELLEE